MSETTLAPEVKVFVKNMGCKVNAFDADVLQTQFKAKGYTLSDSHNDASIIVLNTCSVTEGAEKEARYLLRRYQKEQPSALRVLTGCYAQIQSAKLQDLDSVDFIVPNEIKTDLVELVHQRLAAPSSVSSDSSADGVAAGAVKPNKLPQNIKPVLDNRQMHFKSSLTLFDRPAQSKTRAFVKVQDGCNGFCAYCQIPYARGASRSVPQAEVLRVCEGLLADGAQELVLTGIHIGDYGEDLSPSLDLTGLVAELLRLPALKRLRISSLEPMELKRPLLILLREHAERFGDHFHLPLQSGSDAILTKMRRTYTRAEYIEATAWIREYFPRAHISADVIVGFPGETDEDFAATVACIEESGLASLHVFPYSKRPNTAALKMPGHVDGVVLKQRMAVLKALSAKRYKEYAKTFIGSTLEVLWEAKLDRFGRRYGKTANYLSVLAPTGATAVLPVGSLSSATIKGFLPVDSEDDLVKTEDVSLILLALPQP